MKITKEGDVTKYRWWIGQKFVCHACGTEGILDEQDHERYFWCSHSLGSVTLACPHCATQQTIQKKNSP